MKSPEENDMSEYVRERSTREFARAGGGNPRNKVDRAFSSDEKIVSLFEPDLSSKTVTVSQNRRPREKMVLLLERRSEVKCERCLRDEALASYRVFTETIDMRVCAECADEARKLRINVELLDSHSGKKRKQAFS
jgi:siroheme synthase (precorrin-2 oxidase/ferrochelatase)